MNIDFLPQKGLFEVHKISSRPFIGEVLTLQCCFLIGHSPMAVATPHTLIKGFKHVNGESCRLRFFTSIFYLTAEDFPCTHKSKLSQTLDGFHMSNDGALTSTFIFVEFSA
jgi:hypothetical protein